MSDLLNVEALALFLLFVVPGLIIAYVRSLFLTRALPTLAEGVAGYIILSLLFHAVLFPFAIDIYMAPVRQNACMWFFILFILPSLIGFVLGTAVQKGWLKKICNICKINPVHPVKAAWDWKFNNSNPAYVQVTLKNGIKWTGYMGPDSFASSCSSDRDLYIEEVYIVHPDDTWETNRSGVWLSHGEIQSIEIFYPKLGDENDKNSAGPT